jgi:sulfide dehydrogenase cytochrome subunit
MSATRYCLILLLTLPGILVADEFQSLLLECESCHGPLGASTENDIPIIGGQSVKLISKALREFQYGERPCKRTTRRSGEDQDSKTDMCQVAASLDDADIEKLGQHFGSQTFQPARQEFDQAKAVAGASLHELYCVTCHLAGGSEAGFGGRLAGQWMPYLETSIGQIRSGEWLIPPMMEQKLSSFSDEEIQSLLNYYASQQK